MSIARFFFILSVCLATVVPVTAEEAGGFACTSEMASGKFMFSQPGMIRQGILVDEPPTGGGAILLPWPRAKLGVAIFDSEGKAVSWHQTDEARPGRLARPAARPLSLDVSSFLSPETDWVAAGVLDIQNTVGPDCRGTLTFRLRQTGAVCIDVYRTVYANGGREIRALRTGSAGRRMGDFGGVPVAPFDTESGPVYPGLGGAVAAFKRLDPADQEIEAKLDALAGELANIKELLRNVARVQGLAPVP